MTLALVLAFLPARASAAEEEVPEAPLELYAKAYALLELETGRIICGKNQMQELPMASTTKIMTCILAIESGRLEEPVTAGAEEIRVEGSSLGLQEGDVMTLHDMLRGLMMVSGNDAAQVIATFVGGTMENFVQMMNDKAKELGLTHTSYANPHGLYDDDHYTTAQELATLAAYALKNPVFCDIVSTPTAKIHYIDSASGERDRTLKNSNTLLTTLEGCIGVKTGYVKKSGRCLVSAAERDGAGVVCVVLNCSNSWEESRQLIEYGFKNVTYMDIVSDTVSYDLNVVGGVSDTVSVQNAGFLSSSLRRQDAENLQVRVVLPRFVYAPVQQGEAVGKICVYLGDELFEEIDMIAMQTVDRVPAAQSFFQTLFELLRQNLQYMYQ